MKNNGKIGKWGKKGKIGEIITRNSSKAQLLWEIRRILEKYRRKKNDTKTLIATWALKTMGTLVNSIWNLTRVQHSTEITR